MRSLRTVPHAVKPVRARLARDAVTCAHADALVSASRLGAEACLRTCMVRAFRSLARFAWLHGFMASHSLVA